MRPRRYELVERITFLLLRIKFIMITICLQITQIYHANIHRDI